MFGDPTGLYRVNLIDYALARGAEVREFVRDGRSMATVSYGETTATYRLNSGMINDYAMNERFGWSSLLTDSQRSWGYGISISDGGASVRQLGLVHTPVRDSLIAGLAVTPIIRDIVAIHRVSSVLQTGFAQTATSNKGKVYDITPSSNHSVTTGNPITGRPNSSVDIQNNQGQIVTRRWFDSRGNQIRDIDLTNHGNPRSHPEVPHQHGPRIPRVGGR